MHRRLGSKVGSQSVEYPISVRRGNPQSTRSNQSAQLLSPTDLPCERKGVGEFQFHLLPEVVYFVVVCPLALTGRLSPGPASCTVKLAL